jgi:hypothetical protein
MLIRIVCILSLVLPSTVSLRLSAEASGVITGVVVNDRNEPVGAEISAYRLTAVKGTLVPLAKCFASVKRQGSFRCEQLPPGQYVLVVNVHQRAPREHSQIADTTVASSIQPVAFAATSSDEPKHSLPLFALYPDQTGTQVTRFIHLSEGQAEYANIQIDSENMSVLKSKPILGFATGQVQIFAEGDGFSLPLNTQASVDSRDGDYLWDGVPPGTYKIVESWTGQEDGETHAATKLITVAPSAPQEISLADARGYQVTGRIDRNGKSSLPVSEIILEGMRDDNRHYTTKIQKNGLFDFKDIPEGSYRLSFAADDSASAEQVTVGGESVQGDVIAMGESISGRLVVVTAGPATGSISGMVKLDGSERKPGVVILSLHSHTAIAVPVQSGGSFRIAGLAPGPYRISGWADISTVPYNTAAFLRRYKDQSVEVDIDNESPVTGVELRCNKSDF